MSKKLTVLVAILAVSFLGTAFAAVENVKVGGKIDMYALSRSDFHLGKGTTDYDASALASILKLSISADLTEDVSANTVLFHERIWGGGTSASGTATGSGNMLLGGLWITLKNFLDYPLTLKIGKQGVKIGSGLIVADPNTNYKGASNFAGTAFSDLCGAKTFEGIMATLDYSPLVLNLGLIKNSEGDEYDSDDRDIYILDANYEVDETTSAELYYILDDRKKADIGNIGVRVVSSPVENLILTGEIAYQYQRYANVGFSSAPRTDKHSSDLAILASATYKLTDTWVPMSIGLDYIRISDKWDPMYEEITPADIANALFKNSNYQAICVNLGADLTDDVSLSLRYANLRLVGKVSTLSGDTNSVTQPWGAYTMDQEKDLGNEIDLHLTYNYTEDVQFSLMYGYFNPGDAFNDSNDDSASQVIGKMKITF